ncbi:MAG TPA: SUMF1/EgtB/PvdO family nonheme iron enzyme [Mesotoga sp.]|nr:SUMF1/EgtB/PvdO family nonheme iron enzyme [Mesotoga sp.]
MKNRFLSVCLFAVLFSTIFLLLGCPNVSESPTLNIPNQTVDEGQVLQFDLKQYAADKNINALTFTIVSGVGEIVGTDYKYLPNYAEAGLKSVTIKVTNLSGKSVQSTFNIDVVDTPIEIEVQKIFNENKTLISWQEVADGADRIVVEKKVGDGVFAQIDELTADATHCENIVVANVRNTYRIKLYMETAFDTSNEVMFQFFESEDDIQFEFDGVIYTIDKEFSAENTEFSIREESGILHIDMLVDDQAPEASYKTSQEYSTYLTCPLVWPISLSWAHSPGSYYAEVSRRIVQITPISYFEYEPYEIPITSKEISGQVTDRLIVDFVPLDAAAAFFEFIEPIGLKQYTASILGYHEIEEYEHLVYFEPSNSSVTGYKKYSETVDNNFEPKNDFALIFIHGKQGTRIGESAVTGEDEEQRERWAEFYKKFNSTSNTFDYFEYYYDSNVRTATEYGEELYRIMDTAGIFDKYEKIFIISHSMGGLVSRGLLKELNTAEVAKIEQVYTLDTPHEGSPLASLIRTMTDENEYNRLLWYFDILELRQRFIDDLLLKGIRIITGTIKAGDLAGIAISELRELAYVIVDILKETPILFTVLIANYGRNLGLELAPYPGYTSIEYTYQDYLDNLSTELNNVNFPANTELNGLKTNLDKITYIKGKIATTKFQPSEEITIYDVGLLLCQMIFEEFADIAGMPAHSEGDGFVSLISQSLGVNEVLFDGINHDRITKDEDVVSYVHNDVIGRLDNSIPSVTKVSGPNGEISGNSSTFTWTGSDSDGTITKYEYRKDEGGWVSNGTSTSYTWNGYSEGQHKFEVRAQDNEGAYSNIISWSFTYSTGTIVVGEMVLVEGGTFMMGDTWGDGRQNELPVHEVTLSYDFFVGKYEVTFEEYDAFCDATGRSKPNDSGWGRGTRPVINIYWKDAVAYCNWLSEKNNLPKAYDSNGNLLDASSYETTDITKVVGYRLLTEAEWEYAARGGNESMGYKYSGSNTASDVAWYSENSGGKTHEVGTKLPNELGIYDMSGNVWEWCSDWYSSNYYSTSPSINPYNHTSSSRRVERCSGWREGIGGVKVSNRYGESPSTYRYSDLGFRVARTATSSSSAESMPTARSWLAAVNVGDKIMAIGGGDRITKTPYAKNEIYNPITNSWETLTPMPTPRYALAAAEYNGKVYVFGGQQIFGNASPVNNVEIYDPVTDSWSTGSPMPNARCELAAATCGDKIFVIAGLNYATRYNTLQIYSPGTDSWSTGASLPKSFSQHAAIGYGGKVYVFGGMDNSRKRLDTVYIYDPQSDTWSSGASAPTARSEIAAAVAGSKIYIFGGITKDFTEGLTTVDIYDPLSDSWQKGDPSLSKRSALAAASVGSKAYLIGGYLYGNPIIELNSVEAYSTE